MHRSTKSRFSRRAVVIALASFVAMLGLGIGGYAYAAGTNQPSIGLRADGQEFFCIGSDKVMHVNPAFANGSCPAGTSGLNYPVSGSAVAAAVAPVLPRGYGMVNVTRGASTATWATYDAILGGPVNTTSGAFRFTCTAANAPCKVSLTAYATTPFTKVYERMIISKEDIGTGAALGNCEYSDGSNNANGNPQLVSQDAAAPTTLNLAIGGSLDCGAGQTYPGGGVVPEIDVPAGYYNVATTLNFTS